MLSPLMGIGSTTTVKGPQHKVAGDLSRFLPNFATNLPGNPDIILLMLQEAEAVVIGSGALGSSVAFHLAKAGLAPVALVDKHEIASQTSPRAAGLTSQIRQSELMTRLATMAVDKIKNFTIETGEEMLYYQSGSLKIARTPEHGQQLKRDVELG